MLFSFAVHSSHIVGGEIFINHIHSYDYEIKLNLYRDVSGIAVPPNYIQVSAMVRETGQHVEDHQLPLRHDSILISTLAPECGNLNHAVEIFTYFDTISLNPSYYSHQGGYLFSWASSARSGGIVNIVPSQSVGSRIVTFFPPLINAIGNQIVNSTPTIKTPINNSAILGNNYSQDFGGTDPDGDSLVYKFYTPFNNGNSIQGIVTPITNPYLDPQSQFPLIQWSSTYSTSNQMHGQGSNSLSLNQSTGELSVIPSIGPAFNLIGIACYEYRYGDLLGIVYREFQIRVKNPNPNPNNPPVINVPNLQALASWSGDTMVFTGSPVCVQIDVDDPDPNAQIVLEVISSDYGPNDHVFVEDTLTKLDSVPVSSGLCFQPDTFYLHTTVGQINALNPGCYDLRGDTIPIFFKFTGYSNAGWGGVQTYLYSPGMDRFNLISLLNHNPNPGGTWIDLDSSNMILPDGTFFGDYVIGPSTFRFLYIDQQPNYPADTAYLELRFVDPLEISNEDVQNKIYPNPADKSINIHLSSQYENSELKVSDIRGNVILHKAIENINTNIKTNGWSNGLYFYELNGQKGKLIIQH